MYIYIKIKAYINCTALKISLLGKPLILGAKETNSSKSFIQGTLWKDFEKFWNAFIKEFATSIHHGELFHRDLRISH